ncbi:MAG: glutamate synthase subunit alpha, partial [Phycicoccus sp.]|nr:glutamate synthase subunit alpha [Phycicoccus sp.]
VGALDTSKAVAHWKASGLDLAPILASVESPDGSGKRHRIAQDYGLHKALDNQLIASARDAIDTGTPVTETFAIRNVNRTVGTMLGHEVTKVHPMGMPDGTIDFTLVGSAGQSFGAFLPAGVTLRLEGDANDYVGKGLSGGRVVVRPDRSSHLTAEDNTIAGNVIAYGATSGEIYLRGRAGERFCVRNSGATAVVEGVGDHGLEYMTGGIALILGPTGRNVAAGMSGGLAYVLDLDADRVNKELVDILALRDSDVVAVGELLTAHVAHTDSAVARGLLADWPANAARFSLILPRDYQRVLDVRAAAQAEGLDLDGTVVWDRIMEASRG